MNWKIANPALSGTGRSGLGTIASPKDLHVDGQPLAKTIDVAGFQPSLVSAGFSRNCAAQADYRPRCS